jgi:hypothetical protein
MSRDVPDFWWKEHIWVAWTRKQRLLQGDEHKAQHDYSLMTFLETFLGVYTAAISLTASNFN